MVWNHSPCAVWLRCDAAAVPTSLASGAHYVVDRLHESGTSSLRFGFEPGQVSEPESFPLSLDLLRSAAEVPKSTQFVLGRHVVQMSVFAERLLGGVVAVLHARFVLRNETQLPLEVFAGVMPKFPEDRVVALPAVEPAKIVLPPMSLTLMPWESFQTELAVRVQGNTNVDDWRDVVLDASKGVEFTLRSETLEQGGESAKDTADHRLRHPMLACVQRASVPIPSTKANIVCKTLVLVGQVVCNLTTNQAPR